MVLIQPFILYGAAHIAGKDMVARLPIPFGLAPPPGLYLGTWMELGQSASIHDSLRRHIALPASAVVTCLENNSSIELVTFLEIRPIGGAPMPAGEIAVRLVAWLGPQVPGTVQSAEPTWPESTTEAVLLASCTSPVLEPHCLDG
jgi:hypothetical protein